MPDPGTARQPQPVSLTGHTVPEDRLAIVSTHVAMLARTALEVSERLPLEADASDFVRILESEEG